MSQLILDPANRLSDLVAPAARNRRGGLAVPAVLALATLSLLLGGCYERTIRSTGVNSSRDTIQEPYQTDWWLDRQIFRDRP